jgi:hypothetical protein
MASIVEIENIEEMRRQEGIDDVELRMEIRALKTGDHVRLTFSSGAKFHGTVLVRITQIRGSAFRGKLVKKTSTMPAGGLVIFTTAHIHSVHKAQDLTHDM